MTRSRRINIEATLIHPPMIVCVCLRGSPGIERFSVFFSLAVLICCSIMAEDSPGDLATFAEIRSSLDPAEISKAAGLLSAGSALRPLLLGQSAYLEGAWPRSIRLFEEAERACPGGELELPGGERIHLHGLACYRLAQSLGAAGRTTEQIDLLQRYRELDYGRHEEINGINTPAWFFELVALVKAGRPGEAERLLSDLDGKEETGSSDHSGWLGESRLILAEARGEDPRALLARYRELASMDDGAEEVPAPLLSPMAELARRTGDYDEARRLFEISAGMIEPSSASHPLRRLAEMDQAAGQWSAADERIAGCWTWHGTKRAHIRQELEMETLATVAFGHLGRGMPGEAWRIFDDLLGRELRGGFRFRTAQQWEASLCLGAVAALRSPIGTPLTKLALVTERTRLEDRFKACLWEILDRGETDVSFLQLFDCPGWLWGETIRVIGPARADELIARHPPVGEFADALINAMRSEILLASGDPSSAEALANRAAQELPESEALLRGRANAVRAEALWQLGRSDEALRIFGGLLEDCPSMIPLVGARLAVRSGSVKTDRRFRSDSSGFMLDREGSGNSAGWILRWQNDAVVRKVPLVYDPVRGAEVADPLGRIFQSPPYLGPEAMDRLEGRLVEEVPQEGSDRIDQMLKRYETK